MAIFHTYWRAGNEPDTYWSIDYLDSHTLKSAMLLIGEIPVGVFFILSGFLFFKKALKYQNFSTKDFFISRILRIYPPVLASLLIIYLATFVMSGGDVITPFMWFINALPFISEYQGILVNGFPINITNSGVFWTLVWEFRLYITIPFLYLLMKHLTHKKTAVIRLC
ncbi:acyltransferase family protein [Candidatus Symbiopectobacterium sp.]|uniref:acyltransferase family protein n=1 Tax=Candidatus Symbiopectobacterium sp. TaxID=2816440 RepID=UPI00345CE25E